MDNNHTYEQEIDLKDLLFAALHKWRLIAVTACLAAVILGGYKVINVMHNRQGQEAMDLLAAQYETKLNGYESAKASYEREIENIVATIESQNDYVENSILMKISPYDKCVATADVFVKTDYEILPDKVYQNTDYTKSIVKAYVSQINHGVLLQDIAAGMGMELRYLQELVKAEADFENGDNMLHLSVAYTDEATAGEILNKLLVCMDDNRSRMGEQIGAHTLAVMNQAVGSVVDLDLLELQNVNNVRNDRNTLSGKMNGAHYATLQDALAGKQKELSELKVPAADDLTETAVLKSGIKYALMGGILGAFIVIFFICIGFLMSDKIASGKELRNRFGLKILGVLNNSKKKKVLSWIDQWLDRLEGTASGLSDSDIYEVIAANVQNYAGDWRTLLITGTVDGKALDEVTDHLQESLTGFKLVTGGDMNVNAATLQRLSECDGIILVEQKGCSVNAEIEQELETIKNVGKDVVGCIVCGKK